MRDPSRFVPILVAGMTAIVGAKDPAPYHLENGLEVILRPVPSASQVGVVVLYELGGDHDPAGKSGRAHLLEHLYCTAAAGDTPARDFKAIQKRYVGGYNQQTGADYTVLAGVVKAAQFEEELKDTAARMSALRITESDLQREVPRVLSELRNMYGAMPNLAAVNHVRQQLHPIAKEGRHGGNPEHVQALTLAELQKTWRDYYRPNNATLVVAGKFEEAVARKLITEHFGPLKPGKAPPAQAASLEARLGQTKELKVKPLAPRATGVVSMGFAAPRPDSKHYPAFLVVISRLYLEVAKAGFQPGAVPPLYYPPLDDPGTFALQAPLPDGGDPKEILAGLERRLDTVLERKVTAAETQTTVQSLAILGTVDLPAAMWAQNIYGLAFGTARRAQLGIDGPKLAKQIKAVTDEDLQVLAERVLARARRSVVIVKVTP